MKKILLVLLTVGFFNTGFAATSLLKIGGGAAFNNGSITQTYEDLPAGSTIESSKYEDNNFTSIFAKLEHGLPFVPNFGIEQRTINLTNDKTKEDEGDNEHFSYIFYYSIGAGIADFNLGLIQDNFELDKSYSSIGVYAKVILDVPLIPITPSLTYSAGSGDENVQALGLNFAFSLAPGFYLDFGTKTYDYLFPVPDAAATALKDTEINYEVQTYYLGFSFNLGI